MKHLLIKQLLVVLIIISIIIETVFFPFPFFLILGTVLLLFDSSMSVCIFLLIASVVLDSLRLEAQGTSAIVLFSTVTLIFLYRKTFEITNVPFVVVAIFAITYFYARYTHHYFNIIVYAAFMLISIFAYSRLGQKTNE